jgi:hypothetical protein
LNNKYSEKQKRTVSNEGGKNKMPQEHSPMSQYSKGQMNILTAKQKRSFLFKHIRMTEENTVSYILGNSTIV